MSGKASRERRVNAVKLAKQAVYDSEGDVGKITNPFDDERCARIFEEYVDKWILLYNGYNMRDI